MIMIYNYYISTCVYIPEVVCLWNGSCNFNNLVRRIMLSFIFTSGSDDVCLAQYSVDIISLIWLVCVFVKKPI